MSKATITYKTTITVDLDLNKIKDYLLSKGWVNDGPWGEFGRLFVKDNKKVVFIITDEIGDFNARINELIVDLAHSENRSVPELLEDLK